MTESKQQFAPALKANLNPLVQTYLDALLHTATAAESTQQDKPADCSTVSPIITQPNMKGKQKKLVGSPVPGRRPDWAQSPFSCLLFEVGGLRIAAPLIDLGGITVLSEITPIFAQPDWFMGILRWNERSIKVIDTASLIMPKQRNDSDETHYECVLMLEGTDWGLAIDKATESLTIAPEAVRWRSNPASRPWLLGTVADQMCALLDVRAIIGSQFVQNASIPGSAPSV
ncbi:MAG: chemotaxis protein CheW [Pseudomonadales bacterium]|nr:chemotaxis protein CheW [Pseudomonadales bacterium]